MCAVEMVIPRLRSSGALSMAPYSRKFARPFEAWYLVMAAVKVVCQKKKKKKLLETILKAGKGKEEEECSKDSHFTLPWSTWPMVP